MLSDPQPKQAFSAPRLLRRLVLRLGIAVAIVLAAGFLSAGLLMQRPVAAPAWLADSVESRTKALGLNIAFDRVEVVLEQGWQPLVRLTDLQIFDPSGEEVLNVSALEAGLALSGLLRGEIEPQTLSVEGVFATLRRAEDGALSLSTGTTVGASQQVAVRPLVLLQQLDHVMQDPRLAALSAAEFHGLTLEYSDARAGLTWTADGGRVRLDRSSDVVALSADLALLSGGAGVATLEANYTSQIGQRAAQFGVKLDGVQSTDIASQGPALAWLGALRAPISGALRSGITEDGTLAPLSATLQIGAGVLQPNPQTRPIPFQQARSYFSYDAGDGVMRFDELSIDSAWLKGRAEGQAVLSGEGPGNFSALVGQFSSQGLLFNPFDIYAEPVALDALDLDFRLTLDPFRLTLGQGLIRDQGQIVTARGDLVAEQDGWRFALDAQMDAVARARLMALWPERFLPPIRAWTDRNVLSGELTGIDLALRGAPQTKTETYFSFDFNSANVRFARALPPLEAGSGNASLLRNRFVVRLDEGYVSAPLGGQVALGESSFIIPDVSVKGGPLAVARVAGSGTITTALSLLDQLPGRPIARSGLPVDFAEGRAAATVTLSLPLQPGLTPDQLRFDGLGTIQNMRTDALVPGQIIAAQNLALRAQNDAVRVAGGGTLGDVPFRAEWLQRLGAQGAKPGRVTGRIALSQRLLDLFGIALPPGSIAGEGAGDFALLLAAGVSPQLQLTSDLEGMRLAIPPLGWRKTSRQSGRLALTAELGPRPDLTRLELDAPGFRARGRIALAPDGGLSRAVFNRVQVGGWFDAGVTLIGRGARRTPEMRIDGGRIDLRNATFPGTAATDSGLGGPLRLRLDRLELADTIAITDLEGQFENSGGLDGRFVGRVNGASEVTGQIIPYRGRSAIRLTSADAGGVVGATGIIRQARGGALDLTLLPVGTAGAFDGTLRVTNTRIKDAPVIADLLSAVSIVGLFEQLSGDGILLSEVDAAFRLTPSALTLTEASAIGPSLGLSMDGTYQIADGALDMQGAISPVYILNGVGSLLTRKGEGVFGFHYRLTGRADAPRIRVNPLSALAPGILREIFRRPASEVSRAQTTRPPSFSDQEQAGDTATAQRNNPRRDSFEGR